MIYANKVNVGKIFKLKVIGDIVGVRGDENVLYPHSIGRRGMLAVI